jgi:hypothetical protein
VVKNRYSGRAKIEDREGGEWRLQMLPCCKGRISRSVGPAPLHAIIMLIRLDHCISDQKPGHRVWHLVGRK